MKERLILFLKHLGIGQLRFENNVGLSRGFVNAVGDTIRESSLGKISSVYPELNINWLKTGEGQMLKSQEPQPTKTEAVYYAPQLPVSAMAGTLTGFTGSIREWDLENVVVPIKGVDLVIPLSGL